MAYAARPLADRFAEKVDQSDPNGCWTWTGHIKRNGYGAIGAGGKYGKVLMAHRVAWELANGPIPDEQVVDHLCHNRSCVNVGHLRVVPQLTNNHNRKGANRGSVSGVRNVNWYAPYQKWVVRFTYNGQRYSRGYFDTIEEAAEYAAEFRAAVIKGDTPRPLRPWARRRGGEAGAA